MVLFMFYYNYYFFTYLFIWIHEASNEAQFKLKAITSSFIL